MVNYKLVSITKSHTGYDIIVRDHNDPGSINKSFNTQTIRGRLLEIVNTFQPSGYTMGTPHKDLNPGTVFWPPPGATSTVDVTDLSFLNIYVTRDYTGWEVTTEYVYKTYIQQWLENPQPISDTTLGADNILFKNTKDGYKAVKVKYPIISQYIYYIKVIVTKVIDGDTIEIQPTEHNGFIDFWEDGHLPKEIVDGSEALVTIRLAGVDCPALAGTSDAEDRNKKYLNLLQVKTDENNLNTATVVAEEAREFVNNLLFVDDKRREGKEVIVIPDSTDRTNMLSYGRLVAAVYVYDPGGDREEDAICVSRSLIASLSKTTPDMTLGAYTTTLSLDSEGIFTGELGSHTWFKYSPIWQANKADYDQIVNKAEYDFNVYLEDIKRKYGLEQTDEDGIIELRYKTDPILQYETVYTEDTTLEQFVTQYGITLYDFYQYNEVSWQADNIIPIGTRFLMPVPYTGWYRDTINNKNEVPADCQDERYNDYTAYTIDDRNILDQQQGLRRKPSHLRIGDCTFQIPPLSITVDVKSSAQRVDL